MASVADILEALSNKEYLYDHIQFVIDNDLRTVTIPADGVVAGVVGDRNVNRINFMMPRYYNGFDMSEFSAKVHYVNANGDPDYYSVDDLSTCDDDNLRFTWLLEANATAYAGTTMFGVELFKMDGDDKKHSFHTANPAELTVLDGLIVDSYVSPEAQLDILEHLKEDASAYVNKELEKAKSNITSYTDSEITRLTGKAKESDDTLNQSISDSKKMLETMKTARTEAINDIESSGREQLDALKDETAQFAADRSKIEANEKSIEALQAQIDHVFIFDETSGVKYAGTIRARNGKPIFEYDTVE